MHVSDIFPHNSYPEYTYVKREKRDLEENLEDALRMSGSIVSISGPSKSGKSMLVKRVAKNSHIEQIAIVNGSEIESTGDLWRQALDNLGTPTTTERHSSETDESGNTITGGISTVVSAGADKHSRSAETDTDVKVDSRRGLSKLIEVVDKDKFVLLIDDFHYIKSDVQSDIAEAIKAAAERGISICVALVSYRSENLEKVNDDLAGRVYNIKLDYWHEHELREIAELGFTVLNVEFSESLIETLVRESAGSPLLMQLLCYSTCLHNDVREPQDEHRVIEMEEGDRDGIFEEAIKWGGYSDVVSAINDGATTRGEGRKLYPLKTGSEGDYYECCLRAIAANPPEFSFTRNELYNRVKHECAGTHPQSNQVSLFCEQMDKITKEERPDSRLVDWDEDEDTLHISEPGLLFNIRWSVRLGIE
ncbi:ATP-binding protein [Salinigranum salinum]|uniref:ATP-binding protein n=1 Tax=Salinigranum salinum TaxID=1364937 RepID=UPI001863AF30|nr:ATP-binding protein [Salinigranum salinum]